MGGVWDDGRRKVARVGAGEGIRVGGLWFLERQPICVCGGRMGGTNVMRGPSRVTIDARIPVYTSLPIVQCQDGARLVFTDQADIVVFPRRVV